MSSNQFIKKNTLIGKIIENHPETISILMSYGLHCVGCRFSNSETLEEGAKKHGMDEKTIEMVIKDINKLIKQRKKD